MVQAGSLREKKSMGLDQRMKPQVDLSPIHFTPLHSTPLHQLVPVVYCHSQVHLWPGPGDDVFLKVRAAATSLPQMG